jgi:cation:H+ antiporter
MSTSLAVFAMLGGLSVLGVGGEAIVRGAATLARIVGLTPAVIGLTVVAAGTSLPELVVSGMAALRGSPAIAVANVVGSNIFNVVFVLGVTAAIAPLPVRGNVVRVEWPFLIIVSCLTGLVMRDLMIDRVEGAVFSAALIGFMAFSVWLARREVVGVEAAQFEAEVGQRQLPARWRELGVAIAFVAGGLLLLVLGGGWLVDGAVAIARSAGLSERVIGLTIVAAGTSAPEAAASIVAARRGQADIAIGNIIGSNIFNLLGILGLTALLTPVAVPAELMRVDFWWMLGTSAVLFPVMRTGLRISRAEGVLLLAIFALYLGLLLRTPGS